MQTQFITKKTEKFDQRDYFPRRETELCENLLDLKEKLQPKFDRYRFEGQCFEVNKELLIKYGCFLRVFKLKKKFRTVMKKDRKMFLEKMFLVAS